jgi:hypothetical protein
VFTAILERLATRVRRPFLVQVISVVAKLRNQAIKPRLRDIEEHLEERAARIAKASCGPNVLQCPDAFLFGHVAEQQPH